MCVPMYDVLCDTGMSYGCSLVWRIHERSCFMNNESLKVQCIGFPNKSKNDT